MNAGVIIERGASPWQIFQQGPEGTAPIRMEGTYHLVRLSQELPLAFSEVPPAKATVKARVALESTGESVVPWTECEIPSEGTWRVTFPAVPAGGLYRLETTMTYEGWDGLSCTRGDMVHHVGVGDVFVIAGQSNAAGRAKDPVADDPEPGVSVLRPSGRWDLASHPLGETTGAVYVGHYENHNPGHSPWLHFAKRLKRELGYPIGLVPCAYGGAPLRWWNPEENGALLRNMLDMLDGLVPRAILWVQGEAEGYENSAESYLARFGAFVRHTREALGQPNLPFLTVQINRCVEGPSEVLDRQWGMVRRPSDRRAMRCPGWRWCPPPTWPSMISSTTPPRPTWWWASGAPALRSPCAMGGPSTGRPRSRKRRGSSRRTPFCSPSAASATGSTPTRCRLANCPSTRRTMGDWCIPRPMLPARTA